MGLKRKASEDTAADADQTEKKTKQTDNDNEIERIYQLGKAWSIANEAQRDPNAKGRGGNDASKRARDQIWEETLAQHLARAPPFLDALQKTSDFRFFQIGLKFVASVHLPGRWVDYKNWGSWNTGWWKKHRTTRSDRVLNRAIEIVEGSIEVDPISMNKTFVEAPLDTKEAHQMRVHTFQYQRLRKDMVGVIQAADQHQYLLLKGMTREQLTAGEMSELTQLEDTKTELRSTLRSCTVEGAGRAIIDELLMASGASMPSFLLSTTTSLGGSGAQEERSEPALSTPAAGPSKTQPKLELPSFNEDSSHDDDMLLKGDAVSPQHRGAQPAAKEEQGPSNVDDSMTNENKIAKINADSPFKIHMYEPEQANLPEVVRIVTPGEKSGRAKNMDPKKPSPELKRPDELGTLDRAVTKALQESGNDVDETRFKRNFQTFGGIENRPQAAANPTSKARYWISRRGDNFLMMIYDNLYHIKALTTDLVDLQLLREEVTDLEVNACLRRMWALAALMYGAVSEGAVWLTVMDALLEDLADLIKGSVIPKHNTARMQNFASS
ncbi:hypothetical protein MBLNU230_g4560t1 [Neophaeotheca triangularis]